MLSVRKILLTPLGWLYGAGVSIRKALYDIKVYKRIGFDLPVISVGNLSVGGTGKTPFISYIIRLIHKDHNPATLSRGYGRRTKGFRILEVGDNYKDVGDEPLFLKQKFTGITVAVGEERILAIPEILASDPDINVILLDDAFQHLAVEAGLNILLTDFENLFYTDRILPAGRLRESKKGASRADIIIITKCPVDIPGKKMTEIKQNISDYSDGPVYFSGLEYGKPYSVFGNGHLASIENGYVFAVCGIAKPKYLENYLTIHAKEVEMRVFPDHFDYTGKAVQKLLDQFHKFAPSGKIFVTTEKDAVRLKPFKDLFLQKGIELYSIPVEVKIIGETERFNAEILSFIKDFK